MRTNGNLAKKIEPRDSGRGAGEARAGVGARAGASAGAGPAQIVARVVSAPLSGAPGSAAGGVLSLRIEEAEPGAAPLEARRAASCLLEPAAGDRVLAVALPDRTTWVLAVLERGDQGAATLSLDGDVALRLASGRLDVVTAAGVGVASAGDVAMAAPRVDVKAVEGRLGVERLTMVSAQLLAEVGVVKAVAGAIDSIAERVSQKVKRAYRLVEELDQLRAKRVDYTAEKTMHLHGDNAVVTADGLVKLDGEHIHMG